MEVDDSQFSRIEAIILSMTPEERANPDLINPSRKKRIAQGAGVDLSLIHISPFDFDVSVKDIYSSLKMGATLVIVPKQLFSQPAPLLDYLCDNEVTVMILSLIHISIY